MKVVRTLSILAVLACSSLAFGQQKANTELAANETMHIDRGAQFISNLENRGLIDHGLMSSLRPILADRSGVSGAAAAVTADCTVTGCRTGTVCCDCIVPTRCLTPQQCGVECRL
ncbi:MAG TPA: hypothetical protein VKZ53_01060 [Candidatus Angelobacter sp.]|nr:hypothetical protein [Candidatus Angelobacter sp.]